MGSKNEGSVIMIRVTPEDYERWIAEHDGAQQARLEFGITDGPVYRDVKDPNTVLLHLDVEDLDRARGWFGDDRFKAAAQRAGQVSREIYFAQHK
jgi:hypothetical protein